MSARPCPIGSLQEQNFPGRSVRQIIELRRVAETFLKLFLHAHWGNKRYPQGSVCTEDHQWVRKDAEMCRVEERVTASLQMS